MKKLSIMVLLCFGLSGCAVVNIITQAKFDANEYALINKIQSETENALEVCETKEKAMSVSESLYQTSIQFKNYAELLPKNTKTTDMSRNLYDITKKFRVSLKTENDYYEYCINKVELINNNAHEIQSVIGKKPR
jgi:hypothetical protein